MFCIFEILFEKIERFICLLQLILQVVEDRIQQTYDPARGQNHKLDCVPIIQQVTASLNFWNIITEAFH